MTKLLEWLTVLTTVVTLWVSFYTESIFANWSKENKTLILWTPFVAVGFLALYCLSVVVYRVATFNDCPRAAEELKKEIQEAKDDLRKKGMKIE